MRIILTCLAAGLLCSACNSPAPRLNAPPHGVSDNPSELRAMYTHMGDNALLADMTVSDVHFYPHRARLNALGEERLLRLAGLMHEYGGTVRFNSDVTGPLRDERLQLVRDFLCEAGLDTTTELVAPAMAGGAGLPAAEVILIRTHEGTYTPEQSGGQKTPPIYGEGM